MDTIEATETQPAFVPLTLAEQVEIAKLGAGSAVAVLVPLIIMLLVRRAFRAGEGRFDD